MRWVDRPSHLLYRPPTKTSTLPISHFFNKKIWQSVNYNKNGCKFAKLVNMKEYYTLYCPVISSACKKSQKNV